MEDAVFPHQSLDIIVGSVSTRTVEEMPTSLGGGAGVTVKPTICQRDRQVSKEGHGLIDGLRNGTDSS